MSDLVGNPEDRFSQNEAHIKGDVQGLKYKGMLAISKLSDYSLVHSQLCLFVCVEV